MTWVSPKANMWKALVLFIWENLAKVQEISEHFLRKKGITLDQCIQYISVPGNRGDGLALHLLCIMQGIHYCIIIKSQIHYSHPTAFPSPCAVHITFVYLSNKVFHDTTTKAMKSTPPQIDFNEPLPGQMTKREAHVINHNE